MQKCRKCGVELNSENWYKSLKDNRIRICKNCHKKEVHNHYIKNKEKILIRHNKRVRENRVINKELLIKIFGLKCKKCGFTDNCFACFDLHHKNPRIKEKLLSQITSWNPLHFKKFVLEKKDNLVLLCANCHRKEHNKN